MISSPWIPKKPSAIIHAIYLLAFNAAIFVVVAAAIISVIGITSDNAKVLTAVFVFAGLELFVGWVIYTRNVWAPLLYFFVFIGGIASSYYFLGMLATYKAGGVVALILHQIIALAIYDRLFTGEGRYWFLAIMHNKDTAERWYNAGNIIAIALSILVVIGVILLAFLFIGLWAFGGNQITTNVGIIYCCVFLYLYALVEFSRRLINFYLNREDPFADVYVKHDTLFMDF